MLEKLPSQSEDPLPTTEELIENGIVLGEHRLKSTLGELVITDEMRPIKFLQSENLIWREQTDQERAYIHYLMPYLDKIYRAYEYARDTNSVFDPLDDATFVTGQGFDSLPASYKNLCERYIDYIRELVLPAGRHAKREGKHQQVGTIAAKTVNPLYPPRTGWTIDNR